MEMSLMALLPVPWFGDGTTDHADPLNRSMSVWFTFVAWPRLPAAQSSLEDT
jgi:hypothetical protein